MNQIEKGLVAEAIVQIQLSMGKISQQQTILDAKANIKKTWEELLSEARVPDRDKELGYDELRDPYHPVTIVCLFIYQFQSFAFSELNRACRFKDETKVPTLGPWAFALGDIIYGAQENRKGADLLKYNCSKQQALWRGGGMTAVEIK